MAARIWRASWARPPSAIFTPEWATARSTWLDRNFAAQIVVSGVWVMQQVPDDDQDGATDGDHSPGVGHDAWRCAGSEPPGTCSSCWCTIAITSFKATSPRYERTVYAAGVSVTV